MAAFAGLYLGEVYTNPKGAKTCLLSHSGARFYYTAPEPTRSPFGPNNFDKDPAATRQNLELRCTKHMEEYFSAVDSWAIEYLTAHSERIFKKSLTLEQVRNMYHPTIRRQEGYAPLLRCKLNMPGTRGEVRFWTPDGKTRDAPADWKDSEIRPHIHVSHLWLMGQSCGLVLNVCDLVVTESSHAFPFGMPESLVQ